MRIAILDYFVIPNNAIGNCDRNIVAGLCEEYDFTVFAVEFDNPNPDRIEFVRVPAIKRPLFLLFITYHLLVPIIFALYKLRTGTRFDVVQSIESNSLLGNLVYAHFCHRKYLQDHFQATSPSGLRGIARWLDHKLHALMEPLVYRKAQATVVPSHGLKRELEATYNNVLKNEVTVVANPIDVAKMRRPENVDEIRADIRKQHDIHTDDLVLVFAALGHFERKGVPLLFDAIKQVNDPRLKLIIVGGNPGTLKDYQGRSQALGIEDHIRFVGFQSDIRPYLWASDIFAFPSSYETFSLVSFEAAAAGLPLLVSSLNGVEEFLEEGHNGWTVARKADAMAEKIILALDDREMLRQMGQNAEKKVEKYDVRYFIDNWRIYYNVFQTGIVQQHEVQSL